MWNSSCLIAVCEILKVSWMLATVPVFTNRCHCVMDDALEMVWSDGLLECWLFGHVVTGVDRKEGIGLFNDALNTFYLRLYGIRHMANEHSDIKRKEMFYLMTYSTHGWHLYRGGNFKLKIYFYYTNRGAHIYLTPGGNTPALLL